MLINRTCSRRIRPLLWGIPFLLLGAGSALADVDADLRTGIYSDAEEAFVGGGLLANMGHGSQWYFNPNLEYVFVDRADMFTANLDFHYDLEREGRGHTVWLGGGPALIHRDPDFGRGDDDDVGANLIAGVGFVRPEVRPYLQGKVTLADNTEAVLAFGMRF